jgi:putative membrane protein
MGVADVIPGVSGGTMAFILGIYEELLSSIKSFDIRFARHLLSLHIKDALNHCSWQFLTALLAGILAAIFSLARILSWLLDNHPVLIWSFFFGLIIASVVTISMHLKKLNISTFAAIFTGAISAYYIVGMVPVATPEAPWFIFLSGVIAICAMILPGISGSFILVLMGKYQYILNAVNERDILTLCTFAIGAAVGLASFSRLLNWLFRKYHDFAIAVLTGFLIGSLRKIWPWKQTLQTTVDRHGKIVPLLQQNILPQHWNTEFLLAIALAGTGFLIIIGMNVMAGTGNPEE